MGCCGQGRQTLRKPAGPPSREAVATRGKQRPVAQAAMPSTGAPTAGRGTVWLRYLARSPVRVIGAMTGRRYVFSGESAEQLVDARDVDAMLASRHFVRASRV